MAADISANSGTCVPVRDRGKRRPRERGQAVIEFALMAPILLTLLLGLIELGNGINDYIKIISTTRDAARLGADNCIGITTSCDATLKNLVTTETGSLRTDIPQACTAGSAGMCITHPVLNSTNSVRVQVCYDHPLLIGLAGIIPNPMRMCSTAQMRVIQ